MESSAKVTRSHNLVKAGGYQPSVFRQNRESATLAHLPYPRRPAICGRLRGAIRADPVEVRWRIVMMSNHCVYTFPDSGSYLEPVTAIQFVWSMFVLYHAKGTRVLCL